MPHYPPPPSHLYRCRTSRHSATTGGAGRRDVPAHTPPAHRRAGLVSDNATNSGGHSTFSGRQDRLCCPPADMAGHTPHHTPLQFRFAGTTGPLLLQPVPSLLIWQEGRLEHTRPTPFCLTSLCGGCYLLSHCLLAVLLNLWMTNVVCLLVTAFVVYSRWPRYCADSS